MIFFTVTLVSSFIFALFELKGISPKLTHTYFSFGSLMLLIMIGLNRNNPDYKGYLEGFNSGSRDYDAGYVLLSSIIKSLGLPFETIYIIISLLLISILWLGLRNQVSNWVIFFYAIFPLALDLPQIRNTLMYFIVVLALILFAQKNSLVYLISVIIASTFHIIGLIYIPLAYLMRITRRKYFFWLKILIISLFIGAIGLRLAPLLVQLPAGIADEIKPFDRFFFATQLLELAIDLLTYWWIDKKLRDTINPEYDLRLETLYRFGWYSVLFIPALIIQVQMYRIRRNAQLIKYIYCAIALQYLNLKDRFIMLGLVALNLIVVVVLMILANDHSVYTFFDQNILFHTIMG